MAQPHSFRLGSLDLQILSDGTYYQDAGAVFGIVPRLMWERAVNPTLDDQHRMALGLNSLLVRSNGKLILIETGVGDKDSRRQASPAADGNLLAELTALSIQPEEIDVVVNTHLHADHCGWNTRAKGEADNAVKIRLERKSRPALLLPECSRPNA